jgi:hypothetical protein
MMGRLRPFVPDVTDERAGLFSDPSMWAKIYIHKLAFRPDKALHIAGYVGLMDFVFWPLAGAFNLT